MIFQPALSINERLYKESKPQGECLSDYLLRFLYSIRKVVP